MSTEELNITSKNELESLVSYIKEKIILSKGSESVSYVRNKLNYLKSTREIKNIDDFCLSFFEGENKNKIKYYKNIDLVDELLVTFFWNRIHRIGLWHQIGDVFSPSFTGFNKILNLLDRLEGRFGATPVINYLRAGIHCAFQNWDEAEKLFSKSPYPKKCNLNYFFRGANTFKNPFKAIDFSSDSFDINILFEIHTDDLYDYSDNKTNPILIFSCDKKYYEQFSESVAESAINSNIQCDFLFFIIADESTELPTESRLNQLIQSSGRSVYTIKAKTKKHEIPAMSACGRYLIARDVIERTGRGVFIFDIDFEFSPEFIPDMEKISSENSIGLCFNKYGRNIFPWASVPAASTFIPNTKAGLEFLNIFSIYIQKYFLDQGNWWIDQNALFTAYQLIKKMFPDQKFSILTEIRNSGATNGDTLVQEFKKKTR